jgi:hypothetical protein
MTLPSPLPRRIFGPLLAATPIWLLANEPATIPNLRLWLDAQETGTVLESAGLVLQWSDRSGFGTHATQTDPARQPSRVAAAIQGHPALRFDGAAPMNSTNPNDDGLFISNDTNRTDVGSLILARPYTIFIVDQYWDDAVRGRTLQSSDTNWLLGRWSGNHSHHTGAFVGPNRAAAAGAPGLATGTGGHYDSLLSLNGVPNGRIGNVLSPGRMVLGTPRLFTGPSGYPEPSRADVGEVIAYTRVLSDDEQARVEAYLSAKWGLSRPWGRHFATRAVRFTGGDPDEGLDFSGLFHAAVDIGGGGAVSIGDAQFTSDLGEDPRVTVTAQNHSADWATPNFGPTANDLALTQICRSIRWHNGVAAGAAENANPVRVEIRDLQPGHAYQLQLITFEQCCPTRHYGAEINGEWIKRNFNGPSVQGAPNAAAGAALVHRFVATHTTLVVRMRSADVNGGDKNPILNAVTLEDLGIAGLSTTKPVAGPQDLDLEGDFLHALELGGTLPRVVRGVPFTPVTLATGAWAYAENSSLHYRPDFGADPDAVALADLAQSIRWETTDQEEQVVAVDLTGLIPGRAYRLQALFADNPAAGSDRRFDILLDRTVVAPGFSPLAVTGRAANRAALFTHDFLATSTHLHFALDGRTSLGRAGLDPNPILSALTLEDLGPIPLFTRQPQDLLLLPEASGSFTGAVAGQGPFAYQWFRDGQSVDGATNAVYSVASAQESDEGDYHLVVTSPQVAVTSRIARLDLIPVPPVATAGIVISEFLTDNAGSLLDEDGEASDWIEVQNLNPFPANLAGWRLTDTAGSPAKWVFPTTVVPAGGFVVVFASDKNRREPGRELHTNFRLSATGEYLALVDPSDQVMQAYAPAFPAQWEDLSFGRARQVTRTPLVEADAEVRYHVPTDDSLGDTWRGGTEPFDQTLWPAANLPLGYDRDGGLVDPAVQVVGHALISRSTVDGAVGGLFIQTSAPFTETGTVDRWHLFGGVSGRSLTPVLVFNSNGTYVVTGIGTTRTVVAGLQSLAFDLVAGSAEVGPGHYFAWKDGSVGANNAGSISYAVSSEGTMHYFANRTTFSVGEDLGPGIFYERQYSVQAEVRRALGSYVRTDFESALRGVNPSLFVRAPFTLGAIPSAELLRLRVRHEDGFVAWLNGVEVARRLAPADLTAQSAATADRSRYEATVEESIDLSAHLGLLQAGPNVLAVQGLNESLSGEEFLLGVVLELEQETIRQDLYLEVPTPGAPNAPGFSGFVDPVVFSPPRGLRDTPAAVVMSSATPGAVIHYTLDGSEPVAGISPLYTGAVEIASTRHLRARAFLADHRSSPIATHTYVFPDLVVNQPVVPPGLPSGWSGITGDYEMDPDVVQTTLPGFSVPEALRALPSASLVMPHHDWWNATSGIYYNSSASGAAWERKVSLEWFTPDGSESWQQDCGVEIQGNSSRNHSFTPKHSLRISFKKAYGAGTLRQTLYPEGSVQRFDQLTLRASSTDSWPVRIGNVDQGVLRWDPARGTYLRDQWMRDALRDLGQPHARGRYAHLYLNGLYWGMYNVAERLNDAWSAFHFGGEKEEYDVIKDFAELQAGNRTAWNQLMAAADAGFATEAAFQALQGNAPDGTRNPQLPVLLHVDNFIDYMITHIYAGAEDWATHNYWASRRRGPESEGFRFYVWDQEISNDSLVRTRVGSHVGGDRFELADDRGGGGSPVYLYSKLRLNPSFQRRFMDRAHALLVRPGGLLTPAWNHARWVARQTQIDLAIVAESARWGDYRFAVPAKRETHWLSEMNWMRDTYWPQIHPIALARFQSVGLLSPLSPPALSPAGGSIAFGARLTASHTNAPSAEIWITLDGRDPRGVDNLPLPDAISYLSPLPLALTSHHVIARVRSGADWSAPTIALLVPAPDRDGDGLPDDWEEAHGLNPDLADAHLDHDEDGHTSGEEYRAGTHPNQVSNVLRLAQVAASPTGWVMRFPTVVNRTYLVQTAPSPTGPWTEIAAWPGTGDWIEQALPPPPETPGRGYARVEVTP